MRHKGAWFPLAATLLVLVFFPHPGVGLCVLLAFIWGLIAGGDYDAR